MGLIGRPGIGKTFPFLFGGTFIEGIAAAGVLDTHAAISLPFRRDFH